MTDNRRFRLPTLEEFNEGWEKIGDYTWWDNGYYRVFMPKSGEGFWYRKHEATADLVDVPTLDAAQRACHEDLCQRLAEGMVEVKR